MQSVKVTTLGCFTIRINFVRTRVKMTHDKLGRINGVDNKGFLVTPKTPLAVADVGTQPPVETSKSLKLVTAVSNALGYHVQPYFVCFLVGKCNRSCLSVE